MKVVPRQHRTGVPLLNCGALLFVNVVDRPAPDRLTFCKHAGDLSSTVRANTIFDLIAGDGVPRAPDDALLASRTDCICAVREHVAFIHEL